MLYELENDFLKVVISDFGAELQQVYHKKNELEYLWQGDEKIWGRRAPVLFPIVGRLKDNRYNYKGKTYELPQHGFARDQVFSLVEQSEDRIVFGLKESEETLRKYPFSFNLKIIYSLREAVLDVQYEVSSREDILFSIGAHPGFNCPLLPGEKFEDYELVFEKVEKVERQLLQNGLRSGVNEKVFNDENVISLNFDLFGEKDAMVFQGLASEWIQVRHKVSGRGVKMECKGFPYFGIWTKPGPLLCLEPWFGVADHINVSGKLEEKEGIVRLQKGEDFRCSYQIELL